MIVSRSRRLRKAVFSNTPFDRQAAQRRWHFRIGPTERRGRLGRGTRPPQRPCHCFWLGQHAIVWSNFPSQKSDGFPEELAVNSIESPIVKTIKIGARLHARYNAEPGEPSGWFAAIVINKRMVSGEPAYLVRWEDNIERWLTEEDLRP